MWHTAVGSSNYGEYDVSDASAMTWFYLSHSTVDAKKRYTLHKAPKTSP